MYGSGKATKPKNIGVKHIQYEQVIINKIIRQHNPISRP